MGSLALASGSIVCNASAHTCPLRSSHAEKNIFEDLNLKLDSSNKPITNNYMTSDKKVFAAGDLRRGQSLIVWAISEGREAAYKIDELLMGHSKLPSKTKGDLPLVK